MFIERLLRERVLVIRRTSAEEWLFILAAFLAAWLKLFFATPLNQNAFKF